MGQDNLNPLAVLQPMVPGDYPRRLSSRDDTPQCSIAVEVGVFVPIAAARPGAARSAKPIRVGEDEEICESG